MYVVDAHVHVQDHSFIPLAVKRAWARQAASRALPLRDPEAILPNVMVGQSDPDGSLTLAAHDSLGVAAGVVPVIDWTLVEPVPEPLDLTIDEVNARTASICDLSKARLFHCAGIDPRHGDARAVAERALAAPSNRGLKLYPATGWRADEEQYAWVYELLAERGAAAVVHTSPLGGDPLVTPLSRPAALAPVLRRHPTLTVIFAHAGFEAWWMEALDIASGWLATHLELSLWQQLADRDYREFRARVGMVVGRIGAHKVIFGSDTLPGPRTDPTGSALGRWLDQFGGLAEDFDGTPPIVSGEQLAMMLGENARAVYHLP